MVKRVGQPHGRGGLALAGRGRRNRRDENELAVWPVRQLIDVAEIQFRLARAV
jgi:hypothetical protein